MVAIDATDRPRPDGSTFEEIVAAPACPDQHAHHGRLRHIEDIRRGVAAGCDLVSTTLSHGVAAIDCTMADGPDLPLLRRAVEEFPGFPVVCEGASTARRRQSAIEAGAWSVVVGTAITHPTSITSWFAKALA